MISLLDSYIINIEEQLLAAKRAEQIGDYDSAMTHLEKSEALVHQAKSQVYRAHLYQSGVPGGVRK